MATAPQRAKLASLAIFCVCAPVAAWAQAPEGLLPTLGTGYVPGGLRDTVQSILPGAPRVNTGLAWNYSASLGVDVGLTQTSSDDPRFSGTDFTSIVSPSINVVGDTRRLALNVGYFPQVRLYAGRGPNQSSIAQNLNASATVTIVPDALFLDSRALAVETSRLGGTQYVSTQSLNRRDAVQTYSFGLSPKYLHRFNEWGTLTVGYSMNWTTQSGYGNGGFSGDGFGTTGSLTTQQQFASFVSGENLARFQYKFNANATQYSGGGVYSRGAYQNSVGNTLSYALNHEVAAFGSVGYQDIRYGESLGSVGLKLQGLTWAVGSRLTPNPDSSFSIQYGKTYGENTIQFDGSYAVTARIRLAANYSVGITTGIEQQQRLLDRTAVGANGVLVDTRTGLPVVAGSSLGSQFGLSRVKQFNFSAYYLLPVDSFSASITSEQSTALVRTTSFNGTIVPPNTEFDSTIGSLSWQHELSSVTSLNTIFSYGVIGNGNLLGVRDRSQNTVGLSTSLSHAFSETLTGRVLYSYTTLGGAPNVPGFANSPQNLILVGLRKNF